MILLALHTISRVTALVLILMISTVTLCTGQEICCSQYEHAEEQCHPDDAGEQQAEKEEAGRSGEHSCCSAEADDEETSTETHSTETHSTETHSTETHSTKNTGSSCDACALCSHCCASVVPGLSFLSVELLPSGVPIYHSDLYLTVSAVYDITEPPPNCI